MAAGSYSDQERAEIFIQAVAPFTDGACDRPDAESQAIAEDDLRLGLDLGQLGYWTHCWLVRRGKPNDPTPLLQKELDCGDLEIPSIGRVFRIECVGDQYDRFRLLTAEGLYVTSDNRVARLAPLEARAPEAPTLGDSPKPETAAQKKARRVAGTIVRDNPGITREDARKAALKNGVHKGRFRLRGGRRQALSARTEATAQK
jgi:hypothetical protein